VVVALGAAQSHAEKDRAIGIDPIVDIAHVSLVLDGAAFIGGDMAAEKTGGHGLFESGAGQKIAGDLLDHELVEGLVLVEGAHDPVAVGPHLAVVVQVHAVGVAVASGIQPEAGHMLAVARRPEKPVHDLLVSVRRRVLEKGIRFLQGGW